MTKYCKKCGKLNENPLLPLCREHYYEKELENKKQMKFKDYKTINKISKKRKDRLNKYSEKDLFRDILLERGQEGHLKCEYCGKIFKMENAGPASFPHILPKSKYPALRLMKNNIGIVCNDVSMNGCHKKFDGVINRIKKDIGKELETMIASGKDISDLINKYK